MPPRLMNRIYFLLIPLAVVASTASKACDIKWINPGTPSINRVIAEYQFQGSSSGCSVLKAFPQNESYELACSDGTLIKIGTSDMCGPSDAFPACDYALVEGNSQGLNGRYKEVLRPFSRGCAGNEVIENKRFDLVRNNVVMVVEIQVAYQRE